MPTKIDALKSRLYDVNALQSAIALLEWDQQTLMPRGGAEARAEHLGILSRMQHEVFTAPQTLEALENAKDAASGDEDTALVRVVSRNLDLATKLPASLVEEKTRLSSLGHEAWVEARANNDFGTFAPLLERLFELARQEAECYGYQEHIFDALLDTYEEGATAADCRRMYEALKQPTRQLIAEIVAKDPVDDSPLHGEWDVAAQKKFTEFIVQEIGFDMSRGRQDTAPHPFCTGWSVNDIRLTTRFKPDITSAIMGSLHEAGHGMYEQGSPEAWDRLPLAGGVSLGIHESQSRLWENIVGRSKAFWSRYLPELQKAFPALAGISVDAWYRMINKVEPSFIRVEADEVTYNMHTLVRFEVECAVLEGTLKVKDIPGAWNAKYQENLGITPATDAEGCLQDVHWSMGSIGYFPTYTMGNLLSYQFWTCLQRDLGDTDALIAAGNFQPILSWLQNNIYTKGSSIKPKDLVTQVTGKAMDPTDYVVGIGRKYRELYGIH